MGIRLLNELGHAAQRDLADVMLDAFGVPAGVWFRYTQREQESEDRFVSLPGVGGQSLTGRSEPDWPVRLGLDQARLLQAGDDAGDRDVRDAHVGGKVLDAALALAVDEVGDRFDVVLGGLERVIRPDLLEAVGRAGGWGGAERMRVLEVEWSENCSTSYSIGSMESRPEDPSIACIFFRTADDRASPGEKVGSPFVVRATVDALVSDSHDQSAASPVYSALADRRRQLLPGARDRVHLGKADTTMVRSSILLAACVVALSACGPSYYRVTSPDSGKAYYTTDVKRMDNGAIIITDAASGAEVTLTSSSVQSIDEAAYKKGLEASDAPAKPEKPVEAEEK